MGPFDENLKLKIVIYSKCDNLRRKKFKCAKSLLNLVLFYNLNDKMTSFSIKVNFNMKTCLFCYITLL